MDNIVPDGFSSSYNRKSKKCQRDAIQAQLVKEQKLIDKGENVCSREMGYTLIIQCLTINPKYFPNQGFA